jgi:hypothetical protein
MATTQRAKERVVRNTITEVGRLYSIRHGGRRSMREAYETVA